MIHHVATINLIYFSWLANFPRMGSVVIVVHDIADIPLAVSCLDNSLAFRVCLPIFDSLIARKPVHGFQTSRIFSYRSYLEAWKFGYTVQSRFFFRQPTRPGEDFSEPPQSRSPVHCCPVVELRQMAVERQWDIELPVLNSGTGKSGQ